MDDSKKPTFAWSETKWFAECPLCGKGNEVSEGDCVSGAASQHTCVECGKDFTFRAGT